MPRMLKIAQVTLVLVVIALRCSSAWAGPEEDYNKGVVTSKAGNYTEAVKWFRMAAEQGSVIAQFNLGSMYSNGQGVPRDHTEALKWFSIAAEQGSAPAQFNLGFMYHNGQVVPQDYAEALKWFSKAAKQGSAKAQTNLGYLYGSGKGVSQDYVTAHMWHDLASSNGYKLGTEMRDLAAQWMTPAEIAEAQSRADACLNSNYKNCD